jgi:glycosyltransferase involved in cell wall biosynthesis
MTLHVAVSGWLLGPHSGANRRLLALCEHLAPLLAAGERVTVLHRPDYAPPALPRIEWRTIDIPTGSAWQRARAEARLLPAVLRELGATVLDHGFLPLPRVAVPTCLLLHDLRGLHGLSRWPRWTTTRALRRAGAGAASIVVPSEWTRTQLLPFVVDPQRLVVVPNGVDLPTSPADATLPVPLPHAGYLLHAGHLEARKNLGVVVQALARLPADQRPELWLVGADAGALAGLQRMARAESVAVRAFGVVAEDVLASLYERALAVVLPSRHEGFGLPALEALAHGAPLFVSDAGALPEVVGDAAVVLPTDDVEAWARALGTVHDPALRDAAARRRRVAHAEHWSWAVAAERLLLVWRQHG